MLLSINYSYLKPHINELAEFIAKELDVNASQVKQILSSNAGAFDGSNLWILIRNMLITEGAFKLSY